MTSPSVVRAAVPDDREEIWRLFRILHSENAMFPMSERKVDYHLDRFISPQTITAHDTGVRGFIGVIGGVGTLEGAIMMGIGQFWYSDCWMVEEYLNMVDPAHRKSNHSRALVGYAKNIIDQMLPTHPTLSLLIGIISTKRTAAKVRLYSQMLTPCGAWFKYPAMAETTAEPLRRLYKGH